MRVKKADEFDLNLILRMPPTFKDHLELVFDKVTNGFLKISLDQGPHQLFRQKTRFSDLAEPYRKYQFPRQA